MSNSAPTEPRHVEPGEPTLADVRDAVANGRRRENWSKTWTREEYGIAEQLARMIRHGHADLDYVNASLGELGENIRLGPNLRPYSWGDLVRIHRVGSYAILEGGNAGEQPTFHLYVDSVDEPGEFYNTSRGFKTLDQALVAGVVFRSEWESRGLSAALNERLSGYISRILKGD